MDGDNDLLIFNTATRQFTVRFYNSGSLVGTSPLLTSPSTPYTPGALPGIDPALSPLGCGEAKSPFDLDLLFTRTSGQIEIWNMSMLNRGQTGIPAPVLPAGFSFGGFWR